MDITQALKKDIMIKDGEWSRIVQAMEYEWKSAFCEKCQKVGHSCYVTNPKMKCKPRPKPPEVETKTLYKPKGTSRGSQTNKQNGEWTKVQNNGTKKGKGIMQEGTPIRVKYTNVFEALGIENDPLVYQDIGTLFLLGTFGVE